jgi:hypothetical protein
MATHTKFILAWLRLSVGQWVRHSISLTLSPNCSSQGGPCRASSRCVQATIDAPEPDARAVNFQRIEHYFRSENGWELKVLPTPEHVLDLEAVDFSMDLDTVYFDIPFDKAPRPRVRTGGSGPKI